jgi:hypothetical protein
MSRSLTSSDLVTRPRERGARSQRGWLVVDGTAKLSLGALLVFALLHPDWPRFADKAMAARAVAYPVLVAILPVAVLVIGRVRGRSLRYPALSAFLMTVPFVVDVAGNALDLYDRVDVFDDVCHLLNWMLLCAALGVAMLRSALPPLAIAAIVTGLGAVTAICWELVEYDSFVTKTPEQFTLYRDTLGDLALGLLGSALAGVGCALVAWRNSRDTREPLHG